MKFLVVIPSFNNYDTILTIIEDLDQIKGIDYLVIDYGSTDNTKELLVNNYIPHIAFQIESNYNEAIHCSLKYAFNKNYEALMIWDSNGNYKMNELKFAKRVWEQNNIDVLLGNRFINGKKRRLSTRILSKRIGRTNDCKCHDPSLDFKIISYQVMDIILENNYLFSGPEIISYIISQGFKIKEIGFRTNNLDKRKSISYTIRKLFLIILINMQKKKKRIHEQI